MNTPQTIHSVIVKAGLENDPKQSKLLQLNLGKIWNKGGKELANNFLSDKINYQDLISELIKLRKEAIKEPYPEVQATEEEVIVIASPAPLPIEEEEEELAIASPTVKHEPASNDRSKRRDRFDRKQAKKQDGNQAQVKKKEKLSLSGIKDKLTVPDLGSILEGNTKWYALGLIGVILLGFVTWYFWPMVSNGMSNVGDWISSIGDNRTNKTNFPENAVKVVAVSVGGFWGLFFFSNLINSADALLRGERGWLEDVWVPITIPIYRLFLPDLITSLTTWSIENIHPNKLNTSLVYGGMLLGVIAGILVFGLFRAVTVQRVKRSFDPSPFVPPALIILAANILNPKPLPVLDLHALEIAFWVILLAIALIYESYRNPKAALSGVLLGILLTFNQDPKIGVIAILLSSVTVMGIGMFARDKKLDDRALSEKLRVANYFGFIAVELGLVIGFFGSYINSLA